jgi:cytochrome d ubiquinol oxidase subunit I
MGDMDLLYARWQMGLSLGFHIIFAVIGMAMPVMMVAAEAAWIRTRRPEYLELAKRWARGTAMLFAVGAVSGTVLSFELGLLWPAFMEAAGPIIGMPFSLEGFAFFLEAIFLGLYLYGWQKLGPGAHVFAGVMVSLGGALSGAFVVTANAWMNTPAGFRIENGRFVDIDPFAAMFNPAAGAQVLHMLLAAYAAVGVGVAGIHARLLLRDRQSTFHRRAFVIALLVGLPASLLQPLSGDWAGRVVARTQPSKFAALEGHFETEAYAPLGLIRFSGQVG